MTSYVWSIACGVLCVMALSHNQVGANEITAMKIRITVEGEVLTATMLDTPSSRDFRSMLPLTLRLKDYAGAEKMGYPPRKLSTKQAPAGYAPFIGDIAYYSPWGNVVIFYGDAEYAEGLIKLGSIDGALEKLAGKKDGFDAVFEVMD